MASFGYIRHRVMAGVRDEGGVIPAMRKALLLLGQGGWRKLLLGDAYRAPVTYLHWVEEFDSLRPEEVAVVRRELVDDPDLPLISVVLPVYRTPLKFLKKAVSSVTEQQYPNWELCIADDASKDRGLLEYLEGLRNHPRIKVCVRPENGHISACTNSALELATGDWVAFLDHDDQLTPDALYQLAKVIRERPGVQMIYSDEDKLDRKGRRARPYFKPDFNRELLRGNNYITHLVCYRTSEVRALGGFRVGFEGAQDHDLVLRYTERLARDDIVHIPMVLYHWREHVGSTSMGMGAKNYALSAGARAVEEHLLRSGLAGEVVASSRGYYTVTYSVPAEEPSVTIIIPTRDQYELLSRCIDSIFAQTEYANFQVLVVDNGSTCAETLNYLGALSKRAGCRVLRDNGPFNFARLNNAAVAGADTEFVLLLNNDTEILSSRWISEMVTTATQTDVGVVGAKLLYEDETIQHVGIVVGIGGSAGHAFKHHRRAELGYWFRAALRSEYSAVTGACLLVRRSVYNEVGGLDELNFPIAFNDVDFCLRVREAGYRNVVCPAAELYHHESKSRGYEDNPAKQARFARERTLFRQRWMEYVEADPGYNVNLTRDAENFVEARDWSPRRGGKRQSPLSPDDFDPLVAAHCCATPELISALKCLFNPDEPRFGSVMFLGGGYGALAADLGWLRSEARFVVFDDGDDKNPQASRADDEALPANLVIEQHVDRLMVQEPVDLCVVGIEIEASRDGVLLDILKDMRSRGTIVLELQSPTSA